MDMDGFKKPDSGQENKNQLGDDSQPQVEDVEPNLADIDAEAEVETSDDAEADEAVVAGVAAIGGLALKWHHVKQFFSRWWNNKRQRYWTLSGLGAVLVLLMVVPLTRFGIMNAVGIRASASIIVTDDETGLPLKSAVVRVGLNEIQTDDNGRAELRSLRLGDQEVLVTKPGYGDQSWGQRLGFGSNYLPEAKMTATGTRFVFKMTDWHGGQPLDKVLAEVAIEGSNEPASAFSSSEGLLRLVTPPSDEDLEVTFSLEGYNELKFKTSPANFDEQSVKLVKAGYNAFISKRSGKFDLYRSRLDGSEETKILDATGRERESGLLLSVDPTAKYAALVSTRDGERNNDGFILSGLFLVNLESAEVTRLDSSESITLAGWDGERLIYTAQSSGQSGYSATRFSLRSFQIGNLAAETLETSNYFYGVVLANGRVYYAPGESFKQNRPPEHFMSMQADGTDRRTHVESQTVRIARTDFNTLVLETLTDDYKQQWYSLTLADQAAVKLAGQPASFEYWATNSDFVSSPDGDWLAWQEERDGKDVIILREKGGSERVIASIDGASSPLRWVGNDLVVFRVAKPGESADYIVSRMLDAETIKLSDATNVGSH